jgi:rifampicin phosphotransferase
VPPDAPSLIAWLGSSTAGAETLGGKGASLDRLVDMGFRVPPGFVLSTAAFTAQAASAGGSGSASGLISAPMVSSVAAALEESVGRLVDDLRALGVTEPRFAVRSSAVAEDGAGASYAGLHETELDVPPAGVSDAVRRCWASLWSAPAVAYRARRGLPSEDLAMAVVVQALVPADASAVAFTRHPVTGRDDQVVLTTARGLGDAMVSGTVTPDTWVIDKASRSVVMFERGADPRGTAVELEALLDLVALCLEVEAELGQPVDIEAAITGGTWFVLQARPITTGAMSGSRA